MNQEKIARSIKVILQELGEDTEREGIKATPKRVARLYNNIFFGYSKKLIVMNELQRSVVTDENVIPITVFNTNDKEMLIRECKGNSFCEHHAVPFTFKCLVGIIPNKKLLGMNKIDKIVKYYAARLQIQEVMTTQIADFINKAIKPLGVIVIIKGVHFCAELQGDEGNFTTSVVRGYFKDNEGGCKDEFLSLIKLQQ